MDIFFSFATDSALEQEGAWLDFGGGLELRVARAGNPTYNRLIAKQYEAFKHELDQKDTEEQQKAAAERSHRIMAEVMSKSILLGWRAKEDAPAGTALKYKGEILEYSQANAYKLLLLKDFQDRLAKMANEFQNYRVKQETADEKNS